MTLSENVTKCGCLVLHKGKFAQTAMAHKVAKKSKNMAANIQLKMMEDKMHRSLPTKLNFKTKSRLLHDKYEVNRPSANTKDLLSSETYDRLSPLPSDIFNGSTFNIPRRVKVVLHSTSTNPYLVVFNSDNKFATPLTYLKLKQYNVVGIQEYRIKLVRKQRAEDLGVENERNSVEFEATSSAQRDEWIDTLRPLCCKGVSSVWEIAPHIKSSLIHSMPSLTEEDEEDSTTWIQTQTLKSPVRKISRIARKNSFGNLKNAAV